MPRSLRNQESPFDRPTPNPTPNAKAPNAPKNGEWIDAFLTSIMQGTSVTDAVRAVGVDITTPYRMCATNKEFERAWEEASDVGTKFLEHEAARRAYHGVLKPVFYKGLECGKIREYSDTLLMFLLKARRPEKYREGIEDGGGLRGNVVLNVNVVQVEGRESRNGAVPIPTVEVVTIGDGGKQDDPGLPEAAPVP